MFRAAFKAEWKRLNPQYPEYDNNAVWKWLVSMFIVCFLRYILPLRLLLWFCRYAVRRRS